MNVFSDLGKAAEIWRIHGFDALTRSFKRRILRNLTGANLWSRLSDEARMLVGAFDFTPADIAASQHVHEQNPGEIDIKSVTWFIPDFQHPFYGGIYTILRFAEYLKVHKGVHNQFALVGSMNEADVANKITSAFPRLAGDPVVRVSFYTDLERLAPTDAGIATLWSTAYYLLKYNQTRRKFYFLQDYEPLFYPAGTSYALVDTSYHFGFYALTNTPSLKNIYTDYHGGQGEFFTPNVDVNLFKPASLRQKAPGEPYTVFFYGRPEHPRNAFELGVAVIKLVKKSMGDDVRFYSAGANWFPSDFSLNGTVENLGLLSYEATRDLYKKCDAGLVMMFTRHPSYLPFELMASGSLVISNYNPATTWFLKDGVNCLVSAASASCLAERLEFGLRQDSLRQRIVQQAMDDICLNFNDWSSQIEKIYAYMCAKKSPHPVQVSDN
jgi:O-antigen biosynthesis protein